MLRYIFAAFCISCVSGFSVFEKESLIPLKSADELVWPDTYTLKATKYSLTSNLVEDLQAWETNSSYRVDYNDGAVKRLVLTVEDENGTSSLRGYEIHPETTDGETANLICNEGYSSDAFSLKDATVIPAIIGEDDYQAVGNETIDDKETVKFEFEEIDKEDGKETRKYLWAHYDDFDEVWVPVKFEEKVYNSKLGALIKHEVWEFSDFSTYVDEDVFILDDVCETDSVLHRMDSDKVTRELMFINTFDKEHTEYVFNSFLNKFERDYKDKTEHTLRKAIFHENMRMVATINNKKLGYTLAINHFSDRTPEEMERSRGLKKRPEGKSGNIAFPYDDNKLKAIEDELPSEYDLRLLGLVSNVKNQGDCGSCWTFGTTAAVEGALARVNGGRLLSLSNQALVDCVWPFGAAGCDGGTDNAAYEWMMKYGLPTQEEYGPYKNKDDFCHIEDMNATYPIKGYTDVTPFSNTATKVAVVNHGPLSTSVHVTTQFSHYSSGIYYEYNCNPLRLNHEVSMVGYGEKDGDLFWILKNSWGPEWGMDGYMHISAKDNTCGTTTEPTYVVF